MDDAQQPTVIDTSVPHSARIWNHWLGGKDNYEVDREMGGKVEEIFPGFVQVARMTRQFTGRAVRYLAGEAGIRQFLDVGTGLPTADNTHEVAQRVAPESHILYIDNDPMVLAHAHALLTSTPEGATAYVDADLHRPDEILEAARQRLDFDQPIALMLMGILGHIDPYQRARDIVATLLDALPSGSYLAIAEADDTHPPFVESMRAYAESGAVPYRLRSPEQIRGFFTGLELVEPGLVAPYTWRPEDGAASTDPVPGAGLAAVARKP
ncbi:SAM-dependent methyltransferase [Actinomadura sp. 7K507]|uniref:SAM-dependent methyltransferase n=1 Tax=Actinomadura sp. 7K507 TaxID=2530365 RepID=UPI00104EEDF5|nr:SAM-dependent methyltransferase [Actinomadura sp. 7K507]TDC86055.1 SAM-dependent methyltransferase [Actinomadura sp. 7K507]